jgi:hypothetical protein
MTNAAYGSKTVPFLEDILLLSIAVSRWTKDQYSLCTLWLCGEGIVDNVLNLLYK